MSSPRQNTWTESVSGQLHKTQGSPLERKHLYYRRSDGIANLPVRPEGAQK